MHYLGKEEVEELKKLHGDGWPIKHIADKFSICETTIFNHVAGRTAPRKQGKRAGRPATGKEKTTFAKADFGEQVFKDLPDTDLFHHVRAWDFIG